MAASKTTKSTTTTKASTPVKVAEEKDPRVDELLSAVATLKKELDATKDELALVKKELDKKQAPVATVTPATDHALRGQVAEALRLMGVREHLLSKAGLK